MNKQFFSRRVFALAMVFALLCTAMPALAAQRTCPSCGGTGRSFCASCSGSGRGMCYACGGAGLKSQTTFRTDPFTGVMIPSQMMVPCSACGGTGRSVCTACGGTGGRSCSTCGGSGRIEDGSGSGSGDSGSGDGGSGSGDGGGGSSGDNGFDEASFVAKPGENDKNVPYVTDRGTILACTKGNSESEGASSLLDGKDNTVYRTASTSLFVIWKAPHPVAVTGYSLSVGNICSYDNRDTPRIMKLYGSETELSRKSGAWKEVYNATVETRNTTGFSTSSSNAGPVYQYFKLEIEQNFGGAYTQIADFRVDGYEIDVPATVKGLKYKLNKADKTATFIGPKDKNIESIAIPNAVKVDGVTYKVTGIRNGACKGLVKLTTVSIGKNVRTIGNKAFTGCVKLKVVTGGERVESIGDSAFRGDAVLKAFTLYAKVSQVGKYAFFDCGKMKTLTIKTRKLTADNVGVKAFKGGYPTATVTCPSGKQEEYSKLLSKKGMGKKVRYQ